MATVIQKAIAELCGVDLAGLSKRSSAAKLRIVLADEILGIFPENSTTNDQKKIAQQLRIFDLSEWREIASLQIESQLVYLNEIAMQKYRFKPGMQVRFIGGPVHGLSYNVGDEYIVSKVKPDGRIYLKKTSGAAAYASQLEPATH